MLDRTPIYTKLGIRGQSCNDSTNTTAIRKPKCKPSTVNNW